MNKAWNISPEAPQEFINQFPEYPKIILQLLYNRGIKTQKDIDEFFNADYEQDLHNPYLHKGMLKAVARIKEAVDKKEKMIVYGDYDADGVSASVILYSLFKELSADFDVYIPDRADGYGLTKKSIKEFSKQEVKLIITVDCGITNIEEVKLANKAGIDVIITDHHLPQDELPPALAIVNAKQKDDNYPFKWLCGGALAFKLVQAILKAETVGIDWEKVKNIKPGFEKWLLDAVAICTITDMVPLIGENRTLAKYGFLVLAQTRRKGLKELMRTAGLEPKLTKISSSGELFSNIKSYEIGFILGPRINAAGRLKHANSAFELLISDNDEEVEILAKNLEEINFERQKLIEHIVKEIDERLAETYNGKLPNIIFEGSTEWINGILGIVANRVMDKYARPAFIYSKGEETSKGSSRSIKSFNLVEEMKKCSDLLMTFGGHAMAAGFTVANENLGKFQSRLLKQAEDFKEEDLKATLSIDSEIDYNDVNWDIYDYLKSFEPYGKENEKPKFVMKNLKVKNIKWVGNGENHMQIQLAPDVIASPPAGGETTKQSQVLAKPLKGIAFRFGDFKNKIKAGDIADIVFEIDVNEWNENRELQLMIKDIKVIL